MVNDDSFATKVAGQAVERLELADLHSLAQLRSVGVPRAVLLVCSSVGSIAWANRRKPLERALARSMVGGSGL